MEPGEWLGWLTQESVRWVQSERDVHRPDARPLGGREVDALEPFFGRPIINLASIKIVDRIPNPPFYPLFEASGVPMLDFASGGGITFVDTILIAREHTPPGPVPLSLMFHALVHVVQYDQIGVEELVSRYVRGWFKHGQQCTSIPIEQQAFALQARYERGPSRAFSVPARVRRDGVP